MQAFVETVFDACYLSGVLFLGFRMLKNAKGRQQVTLFGLMAVLLGLGDSFHLVPRAYALLTDGLAAHARALGLGKMITSLTMTVFYVLLYRIAAMRYGIRNRALDASVYALAAVRLVLCLFPQNMWLSADAPLSWAIYRNIPFAILGAEIIWIFLRRGKQHEGPLAWMAPAVTLSFAFYIPVVLWADRIPLIGMLMIPKTCAYFWIVLMGDRMEKETRNA